MASTTEALLGREHEVELLEAALKDVREGKPRFVLVTGEAGIGKTRLLEELARQANGLGCLTLEGRASEFDREFPFGVFTESLDSYLGSLDDQAVGRLALDRLGGLAAVFPSMSMLDDAVEYPTSATERFRVHQAVRELLERLAARRPSVLILDDLHWADGASLELISYLARHPPQAEVLVTMAIRSGHRETALNRAVAGVQKSGLAAEIDLGPLPLETVRQLIGDRADQLHELTGGNPFYALQLARSELGEVEALSFDGLGVPDAVSRAIAAELESLSPGARNLAEASAIVGDPFDLEIAAAAVDHSEQDVLEQLDELVSKDLVRATDVPRRFRFRHPIVRSAVYGACLPSIRISCHQRAAAALATRGGSAGERAKHVEQSARFGDLEAIGLLRRAGVEATNQAPTTAVRWFESALRLLPEDSSLDERLALQGSLSGSLAVLGRFAEALGVLEDGLARTSATAEPNVALVLACAQMEQLLGRFDESRSRLESAYEKLADARSPSGISLAIALSLAGFHLGDYSSCLEWGERASDAAEASEDVALSAAALASSAMGAALAGQVGVGREIRDRAAELIDSLSDEKIKPRLDALGNISAAELYLDLYPESARHGERCLRLARETGQTQLLPIVAPAVGTALWMVGELTRSAEVLQDAIEAARLADNATALAWSLFNHALSVFMAGDLETALRSSNESIEICRGFDSGLISGYAGATNAQVLLEMGEPDQALDRLLASAGGEELPLMAGSWRPTYFEFMARCHLELGDVDKAEKAAKSGREDADSLGMTLPLLMADRAEALVALAQGRARDAVGLAMSSISGAEKLGARIHTATSHALAGRALEAAGRRVEAVEHLEAAADQFEELGSVRYRDQVEAQLRQLGQTVHRRTRPGNLDGSGLETLTGREMEVAELVLDRHTNREIAAELFLSTKTVETHMRNIFNKLGVTSRVEVARLLSGQESPAG